MQAANIHPVTFGNARLNLDPAKQAVKEAGAYNERIRQTAVMASTVSGSQREAELREDMQGQANQAIAANTRAIQSVVKELERQQRGFSLRA